MDNLSEKTEATVLQCPRCRSQLNVSHHLDRLEEKCPICKSEMSLTVFPRLYKAHVERKSSALASEEEATCSFFPELKAEKVCDECGCFMSSRAAVQWADGDYCLPCLHRLREEERSVGFLAKTIRYDCRALALVLFLAPVSLFTAPVALYLLLRNRKSESSFVPGNGKIWWLAMVLSVLCLIFWLVIVIGWLSLVLEGFS